MAKNYEDLGKLAVRRPVHTVKKRETPNGSSSRLVVVGHEYADVRVEVDWAIFAREIGVRALRSKQKRASMAYGAIRVTVVPGTLRQVQLDDGGDDE